MDAASGRPVYRSHEEWKSWQELTVKVMRLPLGCMTLDIYRLFSMEGNIQKIDIRPRKRDCFAYVDFCPPPRRAFWRSIFKLSKDDNMVLRIDPLPPKRPFTHASPIHPDIQYPERTTLVADSLDFGFMYDDISMMRMKTVYPYQSKPVQFVLNLMRKEIDIQFPLSLKLSLERQAIEGIQAELRNFRFRFPLSQLQQIYELHEGEEKRILIIPFDSPPPFFKQTADTDSTHDTHKYWSDWQTWFRQTYIVNGEDYNALDHKPVMLQNERAVIDIGHWNTYRLVIDASKNQKTDYAKLRRALVDYNIQIITDRKVILKEKIQSDFWNMLDKTQTGAAAGSANNMSALARLQSDTVPLDFSVRYQLEVCLSNGWLNEHNITREFLEKLSTSNPSEAKFILEKAADSQCRFYDPMEIFKTPVIDGFDRTIPKYCVYTRAATITPSMVCVSTPTIETSNRIVRHYSEYEDRFLRVKFTDEKNEGRINSQDDDKYEEIFRRIKRAMTNGIVIGDRHYEFLAFGNSQFREHGAYFFASTDNLNADNIRLWMGSFSHINVVARYAARLGQCFSTTRAITGTTVKVETMPDIKSGPYTFTDGVGKISRFLAVMIAQEFGLPNAADDYPSLFQFRLGGCKGVLAVAPDSKANEIQIRPSQYKFAAAHEGLEIIRTSAFATACLNRQLIIVLSTLGVPDKIFAFKQQEMLRDLTDAMTDEQLALQKLQRNVDINQTTLTMAAMILDGFMRCKEPFIMSVLQLWRTYNIKYLKEKARIVIEKGAFMLGCIDETATLRGHHEDPQSRPDATREEKLATLPQIFLQISDPKKKGTYKVIEGICILARNPSLHPGDIRIVCAVDLPALHHLKNVVVLPQTGDRDISNMCSGGDLDGDDYLVMWDVDLLPQEINHPPMDYTPPPRAEIDRKVGVDDITTFFVTYMKNDSLGKIANAHLAQADFSDMGARDEKCLALAELHSCAVDYPKSGVPARIRRDLVPRKYPHFMENKYRSKDRIYHSQKILGKLYDQVERADFMPIYEQSFDKRILEAYDLPDEILDRAAEVKVLYDAAMRRIMAQHAIQTEFEVWSTFVLDHNRESKDFTFGEEIGRISMALKHRFQAMCLEKAGSRSVAEFDKVGPFVAAMYTVTARETTEALEECHKMKAVGGRDVPVSKMVAKSMPLISFPWIFVNELGKVATGGTVGRASSVIAPQGIQRRATKKPLSSTVVTCEDNIETEGGITHRGELLELFEDAENYTAMVQSGTVDSYIQSGIKYDDWASENEVLQQRQTANESYGSEDRVLEACRAEIEEGGVQLSSFESRYYRGGDEADIDENGQEALELEAPFSSDAEDDEGGEEVVIENDDQPTALESLGRLLG
ncbi:RdRP-domain-containing protein [Lepidopterella palustris CBS 459.81]|uniref:RNA-dependent RNA polymerase n=1 Tax=Lepidopterella palustris CBS 459.81 TaxID=1314670 RepID=A0A8E2EFL8_9PEZI|nr:RdRP-domain-containing protein [Lepidopterella palustris CBS 459.81]